MREVCDRFGMGRTVHSALTSLLPVGNGLLRASGFSVVMREPGRLLCRRRGTLLGQDLDDLQMLLPPGTFQQSMIGRFLNQHVLERIDRLRDKAGFVQEFGGLELCQALGESLLGQPGNGSEEREGHLLPNDRRVLQHTFSDCWQAIHASRQHRMDGVW